MNNRPLSPHLQIYKPQMTSVLSILHRITGLIIALGAVVIGIWFWSITAGEQHYLCIRDLLVSPVGKILLFIWSGCTCYHLFNGIRHLIWDFGYGFELSEAYLSGKLVIAATVLMTLGVWIV